MLKILRTNTKWIMVTVAVCFIIMMVVGWGMNYRGTSSGVEKGVICKINDEEISYTNYDRIVKNQRERYGRTSRSTYETERRIHSELWDYLVTQTLISQDIKKRNISYSDNELVNFILNNPIQGADQISLFLEDDKFSLEKYQAFIKNPEYRKNPQTAYLLQVIENEAVTNLPLMKFQMSLVNSIPVSDAMIRDRWLTENEKRKAEWVFLNVNSLYSLELTTNSGEVRTYFEEHAEDYKRGERRSLEAVFFKLSPTAADSAETLERSQLLADRARGGEDFSELANSYSEDTGNEGRSGEKLGGDLGFFGRGRMIPEFEKVAFSLKPGESSDPVLTQFGYHVIKVDSIKYKDEKKKEIDQVKARHILLMIEPSPSTEESVKNAVTAFYETIEGGMDFAAQAKIDSLELIYPLPFERDATSIEAIKSSSQLLVNRSFRAEQGDLLPIFTTDIGFYVMRVLRILKPGIPDIAEVVLQVENDLKNHKRLRYAENFITRVDERMKKGQSLKEAVEADTLKTAEVKTDEITRAQYIPGLGEMSTFVANIFALENPGDTTGPVVNESGSGIAVLLEKIPVDEEQLEQEREQIKSSIKNELSQEVYTQYIENLKENAKIEDYRDLFFENL